MKDFDFNYLPLYYQLISDFKLAQTAHKMANICLV